jgi:hypothetical protein
LVVDHIYLRHYVIFVLTIFKRQLDESKLHGHSCDTTRTQYQAWIADYLKRGNQLVYFLIHFPLGTMPDNALFSRDCQLKKEVLYMNDEHVGSRAKTPIFASGLRWEIAEHGLHDLQVDEPATGLWWLRRKV